MKRTLTSLLLVLIGTTLSACQRDTAPADLSPLPSALPDPSSAGAYICDYGDAGIPAKAVELMTGLSADLEWSGHFDLGPAPVATANLCEVSSRNDPAQGAVLEIYLADLGEEWKDNVFDKRLRAGGTPMPELLPDAIGVYWAGPTADYGPVRGKPNPSNEARAYLFRNGTEIGIRLKHGAAGRDNAADVLALMKLVAPALMPGT
ncbi:hypothetical protein ACFPOI_49800 [Nonomuraea angiospora]|uniref:DUF3558 domain-containing protein n=1 Tax=Nonomuraea angiospora TaxID=46172 RepID=A0ABR9LWP6_9ACTN|nr:hypothetical protein [Nonomuraea angiospora]MBE1585069.1 hypothetical protein [Nonomuraea angiospora]